MYVLSKGRLTYDKDGAWAAEGTPNAELVDEMMAHPYFRMEPPKSTGRELFGSTYTADFLAKAEQRGLGKADIVATATAFTAHSIADGYRKFVFPRCRIDEVILTGGGAHNRTLLAMLAVELPEQAVMNSQSLGFNDDAKEAVIFALLGNDFMHGICNNLPAATGAAEATVMGKLALP